MKILKALGNFVFGAIYLIVLGVLTVTYVVMALSITTILVASTLSIFVLPILLALVLLRYLGLI